MSDKPPKDKIAIMLNSNDFERIYSALSVAVDSAAMDMEVTMFFSFWSITILRKSKNYKNCMLLQKAMKFMLPIGTETLKLGKMNMFGMGPIIFKYIMRKKNYSTTTQLLEMARELNVKLIACSSTMEVMGLEPEELIDGVICAGASTYIKDASESKVSLLY